ncbi:RNase_PH domain-containing protein/RNase_PH_C domain-containing protein [Cephalotus follicularis]|uniref:Protein ECERIFERUM 7 n=1 Tax=Cephalotus follicularis TaxID=3775 RepID=A0A1Q3BJH1_CEPFO|nr:RNase_PH domain-containing protein/RNase_PH_C domain-containing protein [Cephalotus follicularis]
MDARLANSWKLTVNEKKFIETALLSDLRIDGRNPYEFRKLTIKFGREDGSSEVQLGQTHVMGFVTAQLVQPYRDRTNEGSLSIYTEFSPMADPLFEPGRQGESAVELGRIIDRGLRDSRAVDTESLCVLAGKLVWAIRIDLHILDNGGNLVDAANIAALAALLTFRRPECSLGGEDGQQVIVHPPEEMEPLPLIIHHLPIAVTYAFFSNEGTLVVDPTHNEEAVMGGRMTATVNANGDICAIQKAGGEGVLQSVILQCLRLAHKKAEDITKKIKDAVEAYNTERALRKIKRHNTSFASEPSTDVKVNQIQSVDQKGIGELSRNRMERLKLDSEESCTNQSNNTKGETKSSEQSAIVGGGSAVIIGSPSSWDPYSKGVDSDFLKASLASQGMQAPSKKHKHARGQKKLSGAECDFTPADLGSSAIGIGLQTDRVKTLKDAVKPKNKRKGGRASATADAS